jgi:hypothetical protein
LDLAFLVSAEHQLTLIVANMLSVETAAPSVLLLETNDTHVDASLDALGVGYDQQLNGDFSLIDLSGYRQVFLALDGGPLGAPLIANLAGFAAAGGALHVLGGSAYAPYVTAMNDMLLGCDTGNYSWTMSPASPQFSVVDPGHYLTRNLTSTHDFGNVSATYYQLRITDPAAEVAAVNSAGAIQLAAKPHGDGRLDICTNSPTQSYYAGDDVIWAATVVRNMLDAVAPMLRSVADVPNDQDRQVRLTWDRSLNDDPGAATPIVDYAVYRLIDPSRGDAVAADLGTRYPPGSWEFPSAVPANAEGTYSIIAPTLGDDSVDDGPYYSHFFVRVRTDTPAVRTGSWSPPRTLPGSTPRAITGTATPSPRSTSPATRANRPSPAGSPTPATRRSCARRCAGTRRTRSTPSRRSATNWRGRAASTWSCSTFRDVKSAA